MKRIIEYKEIKKVVEEKKSFSLAAAFLSARYGVPIHKGSLWRAFRSKKDLQVRSRSRFYPQWERVDVLQVYGYIDKLAGLYFPQSSDQWEDLRDFLRGVFYRLDLQEIEDPMNYVRTALRRAVYGHYFKLERVKRDGGDNPLNYTAIPSKGSSYDDLL